ncbi:hypothetical protein EV424DRAFT_1350863 [Suillus variegatus]|nr:hypothetical protein EV424DRAFT_1350863 [Suillus variegatus]
MSGTNLDYWVEKESITGFDDEEGDDGDLELSQTGISNNQPTANAGLNTPNQFHTQNEPGGSGGHYQAYSNDSTYTVTLGPPLRILGGPETGKQSETRRRRCRLQCERKTSMRDNKGNPIDIKVFNPRSIFNILTLKIHERHEQCKITRQQGIGQARENRQKTITSSNEGGESKSTDSTADGGNKECAQEAAITTNTFYEPTVLPDYGGELFQHANAKLCQLDIRNVENILIPPQEWYSSLRRGTLVTIRATLHAFNWKEHRIYQLNAHTIRAIVLGRSPGRMF